jgi:hypothetical protein
MVDALSNKSIKRMAYFEEIFLNRWSTEEDPHMLYDIEEEETYEEKQ